MSAKSAQEAHLNHYLQCDIFLGLLAFIFIHSFLYKKKTFQNLLKL